MALSYQERCRGLIAPFKIFVYLQFVAVANHYLYVFSLNGSNNYGLHSLHFSFF